jgi:oxaloacetate decarboxylase gamma subunit
METNLVVEGVKFMFLGMGTVFLFLIIMITCMNIMAYLVGRFFPEPQVKPETQDAISKRDNKKVVAAITAAIMHHRQN